MSTAIPVIEAKTRKTKGTHASAELRGEGRLPACIYGHKQPNQEVDLDLHDFGVTMRAKPHLVKLAFDGGEVPAVIQDVQYGIYANTPIHVDFLRVSLDEDVRVRAQLEFYGTPVGTEKGGKLEVVRDTVGIKVRADSIPALIKIDVSGMALDTHMSFGEIKLPAGSTLTDHPASHVCRCRVPRRVKVVTAVKPEDAAAAAPGAAGAAAPGAAPAAGGKGEGGAAPAAGGKAPPAKK